MTDMTDEQTDIDLITGHPFQGTGQWGDVCERDDGSGWICGYGRAEHADPGQDPPRPG
jgi:hypothetical protein